MQRAEGDGKVLPHGVTAAACLCLHVGRLGRPRRPRLRTGTNTGTGTGGIETAASHTGASIAAAAAADAADTVRRAAHTLEVGQAQLEALEMAARSTTASRTAKRCPTQVRCPAPKGMNANLGPPGAPTGRDVAGQPVPRNRAGRNASGLG